jgi:hypothetical protein
MPTRTFHGNVEPNPRHRLQKTGGAVGGTVEWCPSLIAIGLGVVMMTSGVLGAQLAGSIKVQSRPLSASVVGTFLSQGNNIELLVLWRGTPGWFAAPERNQSSGTANSYRLHLQYGAVPLDMTYDRSRHVASIGSSEIALANGRNVILVDGIGTDKLTTTVLAVDLTSASTVGTVLGRSPEVVAFLRCDAVVSDQAERRVNQLVCDDLKPKK